MFPLPLAPFELLMYLDDRPDYPMVFVLECDFSGPICRAHFEEAISRVLDRQPMLTACIQTVRGYPHWVPTDCRPPVIWSTEAAPPLTAENLAICIERESGLRVAVYESKAGARVRWHFFHACCDGVAGCIVIGEVLAVYHALCAGEDWRQALTAIEPRRLSDRANFRRGRATPLATAPGTSLWSWKTLLGVAATAVEAMKLACTSPVSIATATDAKLAEHPSGGSSYAIHSCDESQSKQIHKAAKGIGVSINDLLMASLFKQLARWNRAHKPKSPRDLIRITMPTNLRQLEDRQMPAADVMSYAFLDRRVKECGDVSILAEGLCVATRAIQRENLSRQFVEGIAIAAGHPWLIRAVLRRDSCMSTAVLSTVGDPARRFESRLPRDGRTVVAGELRLEAFYGVPPIRPRTGLSIGTTQYRGCLTIAARADAKAFSTPQLVDFLAELLNDATQLPAEPSQESPLPAGQFSAG